MSESPAADTIGQTITKIQAALRDYIEATYHVGHAALIARRRALLEQEGVLFRAPFIESTPRYRTGRRFADLAIPAAAKALLEASDCRLRTSAEAPVRPAVHPPGGGAGGAAGRGMSAAITTGTGSGKTESFLLPMLAKLAAEASLSASIVCRPSGAGHPLYPMNALVNDQLGRLRLLLGDPRVTRTVHGLGGPARALRPLHQPDPLPGGPHAQEGPEAPAADRALLSPCCTRPPTGLSPGATAPAA